MRVSRLGLLVLAALAGLGMAGRLYADTITLDSGSTVTATAGVTTKVDNVTSLPFNQTTSANNSTPSALSGVTSALSTSGLGFTFMEVSEGTIGSNTSGIGDIFFTAGEGTMFSISGSLTITYGNNLQQAELITKLYDISDSTYVYSYDNILTTAGTLTLDTTGGPLTGTLIGGDEYEFTANESISPETSDPQLSGNSGITFTSPVPLAAPLPRSAPAGLLLLAFLAVPALRRRAAG